MAMSIVSFLRSTRPAFLPNQSRSSVTDGLRTTVQLIRVRIAGTKILVKRMTTLRAKRSFARYGFFSI